MKRISLAILEEASVNWESLDKGISGDHARVPKKSMFEHRRTAVEDAHRGFEEGDHGKLIMACGTGKTSTSLKIA